MEQSLPFQFQVSVSRQTRKQSRPKKQNPCLRLTVTEAQGTLVQAPFKMDHESLNSWIYIDESAFASFVFEFDKALNFGK